MKMKHLQFLWLMLLLAVNQVQAQWTTNQAANAILGQTLFTTNTTGTTATTLGLNLNSLNIPGLTVDAASGKLFVSDRGNSRVLRYANAASFSNGAAAEFAFGQSNLTSGSANRGGTLNANTLNEPEGLWVDASGNLWVADYSNNRVLRFPNAATTTDFNVSANLVLGQPNFITTGGSVSQNSFGERPSSVVGDANHVYVAIAFTHRVLRFALSGIFSGASAAGVWGNRVLHRQRKTTVGQPH
jgi:secreted PhoX family phosphatase